MKMKSVSRKIVGEGFEKCDDWFMCNKRHQWYQRTVLKNVGGDYVLYLCENGIFGLQHSVGMPEYGFNDFLAQVSFYSEAAANETIDLLKRLKAEGIIDFEVTP